MKFPRKLKKKMFGTLKNPRRFVINFDPASGQDYTVETEFFRSGKAVEIWSRKIEQKPEFGEMK